MLRLNVERMLLLTKDWQRDCNHIGLVWQARGSPQEAAMEGHSPQEVQGTHRAAGVRAGSRPASFTGSALPPMAHSVGQLPHRAAAGGTPSTTAACAQARPSPDPQVTRSPYPWFTYSLLARAAKHSSVRSRKVDTMCHTHLCRSALLTGDPVNIKRQSVLLFKGQHVY